MNIDTVGLNLSLVFRGELLDNYLLVELWIGGFKSKILRFHVVSIQ